MRTFASLPACAAVCAVLLLATIGGAAPAEAQVRMQGRVIAETTEEPIAGATVVLMDLDGRRIQQRVTDENGRFSFFVRRTAAVQLRTTHAGFAETTTPRLHFDEFDVFAIEIRMDPAAALLAPLEVTARSSVRSRMLDGFEHRRTATPGVFFTQEDVEKRKPGYVTDLLATVPGVRLLSSGGGARRTVVMGRAAGNPDCPAQVYVDGLLMNRDSEFAIDDVVSPQAVHGIEVYRGISTVPADFLSSAATCGVVVIWTRRSD